MSDDVAKAIAAQKRLAAGRLVRKGEIEAELLRRRAERAGIEGLEGAEAQSVRAGLDARIAELSGELASVEGELRAALGEVAGLARLPSTPAGAAPAAAVPAAELDAGDDAGVDQALERVREHIADLEAQARLGEATAAPDPAPAAAAKPDRDAEARAEFEALRAKPKKTI